MFHGVLALLGRSLRTDARSWTPHLARFLLLVAINVSLILAHVTSAMRGAPGLRFFQSVLWLDVIFASLMGIGFFSTVISEEKEEDTLGLMKMAGISPLGILLGKMGGRLIQAVLLLGVQYPFTLLAVTLGGITANQIRCSFAGLMAYTLFLAGLGLLCSTVAARNRNAASLMVMGLFGYFAIPYAAYETHRVMVVNGAMSVKSAWARSLEFVASTCLYLQIPEIMSSGFTESPWTSQVGSNLVAAAFCCGLAWILFNVFSSSPASDSEERGLLMRKRGRFQLFSPGRPRWNPFAWKDFHFVGGGLSNLLLRVVFYAALLGVSHFLSEFWWSGWGVQYPYQVTLSIYQLLLLFIVTIELAMVVSRVLHVEIRGQTLASLVMLPEAVLYVLYSKFAGALLAGAPGICTLAAVSFATQAGWHNTGEFLNRAAGWFFLAHFLLVPHLAMVLSLYLRWGAVPLSIGLAIGSVVGLVSFFEATRVRPEDGIVSFIGFLIVCTCVFCHFWIMARINTVAARG